jgi:hypothetical protein
MKIKLSKTQWQSIGNQTGWMKQMKQAQGLTPQQQQAEAQFDTQAVKMFPNRIVPANQMKALENLAKQLGVEDWLDVAPTGPDANGNYVLEA